MLAATQSSETTGCGGADDANTRWRCPLTAGGAPVRKATVPRLHTLALRPPTSFDPREWRWLQPRHDGERQCGAAAQAPTPRGEALEQRPHQASCAYPEHGTTVEGDVAAAGGVTQQREAPDKGVLCAGGWIPRQRRASNAHSSCCRILFSTQQFIQELVFWGRARCAVPPANEAAQFAGTAALDFHTCLPHALPQGAVIRCCRCRCRCRLPPESSSPS